MDNTITITIDGVSSTLTFKKYEYLTIQYLQTTDKITIYRVESRKNTVSDQTEKISTHSESDTDEYNMPTVNKRLLAPYPVIPPTPAVQNTVSRRTRPNGSEKLIGKLPINILVEALEIYVDGASAKTIVAHVKNRGYKITTGVIYNCGAILTKIHNNKLYRNKSTYFGVYNFIQENNPQLLARILRRNAYKNSTGDNQC